MSILRHAAREMRTVWTLSPGFLRWQDATSPSGSASGIPVSQSTALTCSAIYDCVALISETIATLPCDVYRRYPDGSRYPRQAPPWMLTPIPGELNWIGFVQQVLTSLLLDGNAFIGVVRNRLEPVSLWPLDPQSVSVMRDPGTLQVEYTIGGQNNERLSARDILHIKALTMPGDIRGISPVAKAAASIGNTLAAQEFQGSFFRNGATLGTVITTLKPVDDATAAKYAERIDKMHGGSARAFRTAVFGGGVDVKTIGISPQEIQMIEIMRFGIADAARWFRVPFHMLDPEKVSSWGKGVAEQNIGFAIHTLRPWVTILETAINTLLYDTFLDTSFYCKFNLKGFLRGNAKDQAEYLKAKIECQAALPNEWRAFDDENPLPGGDTVLESVQFLPSTPTTTGGGQ